MMDKDSGFFDKAKGTIGKAADMAMNKIDQWAEETENKNKSDDGPERAKAAGEYEYNERNPQRKENSMTEFGGIPTFDAGTDVRADAKPASGEFGQIPDSQKPAAPNQFAGQVEMEGVASGESRSARYEEQEPVEDFTESAADGADMENMESGGIPGNGGTDVAYGDPIGRYDGNEADPLDEEERQARYEEQEPVQDFLDDASSDGPPEPFGDAGHRPI